MKKKLFITLILCTTFVGAFSQKIKYGEEFSLHRHIDHYDLIHMGDNGFVTFSIKKNPSNYDKQQEMLILFDKNYNIVKELELDLKVGKNKLRAIDLAYLGEKLYVFAIPESKKGETTQFYVQQVDKKSLKSIGSAIKTANVPNRKIGFSNPNRPSLRIKYSEDGKKVLFFYKGTAKSEDEIVSIMIITDENFKKIWEKRESFAPMRKGDFLNDVEISNKGEVFLLAEATRTNEKENYSNSYFYLNKYNISSNKKEIRIDEEGTYLKSLSMAYSNVSNKVVVCGFSTKKAKENSQISGQYCLQADAENFEVSTKSLLNLGDEFEETFKGMTLSHLSSLFPTKEGGVITISEARSFPKSRYSSSNNSGMSTSSTISTLIHKDLFITHISNTGKVLWKKKIEKEQRGYEYRILSYKAIYNTEREEVTVVYNDIKKNNEKKVVAIELNSNGEANESIVEMVGKSGFLTDLWNISVNGKQQLYTFSIYYKTGSLGSASMSSASKEKKYKFGEIIFD